MQRVGQDLFRARLLDYCQHRCPLAGITDAALLGVGHITTWADCDTDAERLNIQNGLPLSGLWDAAVDRAQVSFADDGTPIFSP